MLEAFVILLMLSVLCESLTEWGKAIFPVADRGAQLMSLAFGLVLAYGAQQDLFALMGIDFVLPLVGTVLAGFVISRGSNYIHDLLGRLANVVSGA